MRAIYNYSLVAEDWTSVLNFLDYLSVEVNHLIFAHIEKSMKFDKEVILYFGCDSNIEVVVDILKSVEDNYPMSNISKMIETLTYIEKKDIPVSLR